MRFVINHPWILFLLCACIMWAAASFGVWLRIKLRLKDDPTQQDLTLAVSATLTLLGLIISFTFSLAATRYDQRKAPSPNVNASSTNAWCSLPFPPHRLR